MRWHLWVVGLLALALYIGNFTFLWRQELLSAAICLAGGLVLTGLFWVMASDAT